MKKVAVSGRRKQMLDLLDEDIRVAVVCRGVQGEAEMKMAASWVGDGLWWEILSGQLDDAGGLGVLGIEFGDLNFFGEADLGEEPDAVVVDVEFIPLESVARTDGVGVVVVVPAFAAGEQSDPPVVAGIILGFEAAPAPEVGGGVDEPGRVESDSDAKEGSPEDHAGCTVDRVARRCESGADGELNETTDDQGNPVIFAEPDVDTVLGEIGGVAAEESGLGVEGSAGEDPAGVGPPGAVLRSVRVAFLVGVLMMDAVGGNPEDWTAFEGKAAAHSDEVLDPPGGLIAAVGKQAMVGHADADVDGEEISDDEGGEIFPGEEEEGGDGSDVEGAHRDGGDPVDAALLVLAAHAEVLLDLLGDFGDDRNDGGQLGCGLSGGFFDCGQGSHVLFRCPLYC
jgi:hypothetical protein